jgi:hypothetical protein
VPRFNRFVRAAALPLAVALVALIGCRAGQKPAEQDQITQKLNQMKDPKDAAARARAAYDLAGIPAKPERRDEVAQALNGLLDDANGNVRLAGICAAKTWGTKRHNEATLRKLIRSTTDIRENAEAGTALERLAP